MKRETRDALLRAGQSLVERIWTVIARTDDNSPYSYASMLLFEQAINQWDAAVSQYRSEVAASKRPAKKKGAKK